MQVSFQCVWGKHDLGGIQNLPFHQGAWENLILNPTPPPPPQKNVTFLPGISLITYLILQTQPKQGFALKLVSAIFYEIFIFSPNYSPSKTIKNVFYFIEKALFVLEIFNFL